MIGVLGAFAPPLVVGSLSGRGRTLFADFELLGIVLAPVSAFGFGIPMPLLEYTTAR